MVRGTDIGKAANQMSDADIYDSRIDCFNGYLRSMIDENEMEFVRRTFMNNRLDITKVYAI